MARLLPRQQRAVDLLEPLLPGRHSGVNLDRHLYSSIIEPEQKDSKLMGRLMIAHKQYQDEFGAFSDMFGTYMEGQGMTSAGLGQFFTPEDICKMMVDLKLEDIQAAPARPSRVLDPCCGSGRFMLAVAEKYHRELKQYNFFITNVDLDFTAFVLCLFNAILHAIPTVCIWGNSLSMDVFAAYATIQFYPMPYATFEKVDLGLAKKLLVGALEETKTVEEKQDIPELCLVENKLTIQQELFSA